MTGQQGVQWHSSPPGRDSPKAPKHKDKTLSWEGDDELYEPHESRSQQLRKQIDPRGHLFDVLDMNSQSSKILGGSNWRNGASIGKARSLKNLRAPTTMIVPDPLLLIPEVPDAKSVGRKFLLSRASTMRDVNRAAPPQGSLLPLPMRRTSELGGNASAVETPRMEESPASVGRPDASSPQDRTSGVPPPWRTFSAPTGIPRRWADRARNLPPEDPPPSPPSPYERIRISWLPLARSFTSEFFPERLPPPPLPPLRHSASVPLPPKPASVTSSELESSSKSDRLRKIATRLLPTRLACIVAELSAPVNCDE